MLNQLTLLRLELKQSGIATLIVGILIVSPYVLFLAFYLSSNPSIKESAPLVLNETAIVLPPLAAALWGYLFAGTIFERSKGIFLILNRCYLSEALIRSSLLLLVPTLICGGFSIFVAPEHFKEVGFIALRIVAASAICLLLVVLLSYFTKTAFVGFVMAVAFVLFSYGVYLGWLFGLPSWLVLSGGYDSLSYSFFALSLSGILLVVFICCERWLRNE